jgi:hypothetical protein
MVEDSLEVALNRSIARERTLRENLTRIKKSGSPIAILNASIRYKEIHLQTLAFRIEKEKRKKTTGWEKRKQKHEQDRTKTRTDARALQDSVKLLRPARRQKPIRKIHRPLPGPKR